MEDAQETAVIFARCQVKNMCLGELRAFAVLKSMGCYTEAQEENKYRKMLKDMKKFYLFILFMMVVAHQNGD